jgi:tagatose 1,6-diphosphate aldolase
MKTISIGKLRGLQQITSARGTFTALALDHRQNLRNANPVFTDNGQLSSFKLEVVENLANHATAVLLDPEVSAAQSIAARVLPGNVGLVVALESTGYTGDTTARKVQIIPGWSVGKAKRMGASAIKLLVYYHPDSKAAKETEEFVAAVAEECQEQDLVLMLEPLSYALQENTKLSSDEKRHVVVETARRLTPLGIDILKAEFPLGLQDTDETHWAAACSEITNASITPWILLSAAVDFDTFLRQVVTACSAGASGIAVGRAVWQDAINMDVEKRKVFLHTVAIERLTRLTALCTALARPFTGFYESLAPFDWYKTY